MSKSLAELAQLLSASNEQLFDRYINIRLTQDKPVEGMPPSPLDFAIVTPASGLKPNISVSGSFHVSKTANLVTVTIYNMNANIDTMAYNWAEVELGYLNSGIHASFIGQITNCYMAKPNPNGELVVSVVCANISALFSRGAFEVAFDKDIVDPIELITTCADKIKLEYPELSTSINKDDLTQTMPALWQIQKFMVGKSTRHFRSPMECIAWINSLFASFDYASGYDSGPGGAPSFTKKDLTKKLPPLRVGFDGQGTLRCTCTYSEATAATVKSLSAIGSAFLNSTESATVTAPFNPGIAPGEVIYINSKYFKTRINIDAVRQSYANMGNMWYVIESTFTFSTFTANNMSLLLNNITNKVTGSEG